LPAINSSVFFKRNSSNAFLCATSTLGFVSFLCCGITLMKKLMVVTGNVILAMTLGFVAGCGGGGGGSDSAAAPTDSGGGGSTGGGTSQAIVGVSTPSSVSVVTAQNADAQQ
jgi:uncharacterized membrane protein YgcG